MNPPPNQRYFIIVHPLEDFEDSLPSSSDVEQRVCDAETLRSIPLRILQIGWKDVCGYSLTGAERQARSRFRKKNRGGS